MAASIAAWMVAESVGDPLRASTASTVTVTVSTVDWPLAVVIDELTASALLAGTVTVMESSVQAVTGTRTPPIATVPARGAEAVVARDGGLAVSPVGAKGPE